MMDWLRFPCVSDSSSNPLRASQRSTSGGAQSDSSRQDDKRLLQRVQERDQSAMAELFDRYSGMAYSVALRVLHDPAQAEDIIQEVFFRIWQNSGTFISERGSLAAWLAVTVRNRSIDLIRRRKPSEPIEEVVLPAATDIASEVERRSIVERIRGVLQTLPAEQRESLELSFFEGMTHAEIAEHKGEPLGTVKTRIRAALITLRKAFQP